MSSSGRCSRFKDLAGHGHAAGSVSTGQVTRGGDGAPAGTVAPRDLRTLNRDCRVRAAQTRGACAPYRPPRAAPALASHRLLRCCGRARNTQLCNTGQDSGLELASPRADPAGPQAGPPPAEDTSKPGGDRDPAQHASTLAMAPGP